MVKPALRVCRIADMKANPDDLLVLLAVSRSARFTTAAQALGLNHTTVSRRIAALEKALGGRVLSRAAGGWELTDLGAEAVQVAEAPPPNMSEETAPATPASFSTQSETTQVAAAPDPSRWPSGWRRPSGRSNRPAAWRIRSPASSG